MKRAGVRGAVLLALLARSSVLRAQAPAAEAAASAEISAPEVIESTRALYPPEASGAARVVIEALIAEDGSVSKLDVRSGDEPFASAARRAVERWRFTPARRSGLPVRARISVAIAFEPPPIEGSAVPAAPPPPVSPGAAPGARFEKRWELGEGRWLAAAFEWFNAGVARERDGISWSPQQGGLRFTSNSALTLPSLGFEAGF